MEFLISYALSFVGIPYRWGGENPITGFDCSGLVQEILRSVGLDPPGDQTAQALYDHFKLFSEAGKFSPGALSFYGENLKKITHIGFLIDSFRMVEAGGGGHLVKTKEDAGLQNAFVRIRPVKSRKDFLTTLLPPYLPDDPIPFPVMKSPNSPDSSKSSA